MQKAQALNCLELDFFCNKKQDFEALRDNSNPCHDTVQHQVTFTLLIEIELLKYQYFFDRF